MLRREQGCCVVSMDLRRNMGLRRNIDLRRNMDLRREHGFAS
jgi:hypothetical protein